MQSNESYDNLDRTQLSNGTNLEAIYENPDFDFDLSPITSDDMQYPGEVLSKKTKKNKRRILTKCLLMAAGISIATVCIVALTISFALLVLKMEEQLQELKDEIVQQNSSLFSLLASQQQIATRMQETFAFNTTDRVSEERVKMEEQLQELKDEITQQNSSFFSLLARMQDKLASNTTDCVSEERVCSIDISGHASTSYYWAHCNTNLVYINTSNSLLADQSCIMEGQWLGLDVATVEVFKNSTGRYMYCRCFISDPAANGTFNRLPWRYFEPATNCYLKLSVCPI